MKEAFGRELSSPPALTLSFEDALTWLRQESFYLVWLEVPFASICESKHLSEIRSYHDNWLLWSSPEIKPHEELAALKNGIDLCIEHPDSHCLAVARICSFIRRIERESLGNPSDMVQSKVREAAQVFKNGELLVDESRREVKIGPRKILLSSADFELLCIFMRYKGELLSRDFLHKRLTGNEWNGVDRRIDQRVVRLRKKLGDSVSRPQWIMSLRGTGYRMNSY